MATPSRQSRAKVGDSVAPVAQSTPNFSMGMPGHDFTLQAIMELQKSVGEMNANLQAMSRSQESVKSKVDDLVGWKNKIMGGVAVFGFLFAGLGFLIGKASEYLTLKPQMSSPTTQVTPQPAPANPVTPQLVASPASATPGK